MNAQDSKFGNIARVSDAPASADVLIVCEHASNRIPKHFAGLGLDPEVQTSHIAWDPGARAVAEGLAEDFSAPLVTAEISRLIYDCNRPPDAPSAIPSKSEVHDIPGNTGLTDAERESRIHAVYRPFHDTLSGVIARRRNALRLMVTVHSFTPVFKGIKRGVEIGILHGTDDRFALGMMASRPIAADFDVRLNEPYGPQDGVAHTLDEHGVANGLLNVMIEVRNDVIATEPAQRGMAHLLSDWIGTTLARLESGDAA